MWDRLSRPPKEALRTINAGRLRGKTDINPQWRYKAMTEVYGACGVGWKYEIKRLWNEPGADGQVFAFADVAVYVWDSPKDKWSDPVPGVGGSMLIAKEAGGLHSSDEGYKMAVTDALSVALKMLGVAAEIYLGNWDGSQYREPAQDDGGVKERFDRWVAKADELSGQGKDIIAGWWKTNGEQVKKDLPEKMASQVYKRAMSHRPKVAK